MVKSTVPFVAALQPIKDSIARPAKTSETPIIPTPTSLPLTSNTTLKNTLYENFFDLVSGVNIFDEKNNYKADKVYIHRREFEYYNYLRLISDKDIKMYLLSITNAKLKEVFVLQ